MISEFKACGDSVETAKYLSVNEFRSIWNAGMCPVLRRVTVFCFRAR